MLLDILLRTELDIAGYLALDEELVDVRVVPARTARVEESGGSVDDAIEGALSGLITKNGKSGVVIIVLMPEVMAESPNLPGPQMELECVVRIVENRIINEGATGTGLSAPQLAVHVSRVLNHWSPRGGSVLMADERRHIEEITATDDPAWEVRFKLRQAVQELGRTSGVLMEGTPLESGAMVITLTCAEEGAVISYTLDGSFPGGDGATIYEAPFTVTTPLTVRALATVEGKRPSNVVEGWVDAEVDEGEPEEPEGPED